MMVDFIVRDCGGGEFLPLIVETGGKRRELYRGERVQGFEAAAEKVRAAWVNETTGNIQAFKAFKAGQPF